jgi:uncharacterized membrane protein YdjX (TVP38/TMEM64 family)
MNPEMSRWARFAPIIVIAALAAAVLASGLLRHLSLHELAHRRHELVGFVERHPAASLAAYVGAFVLLIVACLPGPSVMTVAGGLLFGPVVGGAAALASCVIGATIVFLACRTAFGDWAARRAGPTAARIEAGFRSNAFSYLLAMRLMPAAPFFLVNIAAGLARIRLSTLIVATLIGAAPASFIFASLGAGLSEAVRRHAPLDASLLLRPEVAAPLTILALMSLTPALWRVWRARRR